MNAPRKGRDRMDKTEIENAVKAFMHPTVFTGVDPILLVAEELANAQHTGDITEAVWAHWDDDNEGVFDYITKFAVEGTITRRSHYTPEELEPFRDRLALPGKDNLEKTVLHRAIKQEIKELKGKRSALVDEIDKGLDGFNEAVAKNSEVFLFKKRQGDWKVLFSDIDIEHPYQVIEKADDSDAKGHYRLKDPKTAHIEAHSVDDSFYGYIVGSKADIAGLQLKSESYKKKIDALEEEAKKIIRSIEWLNLSDPRIKTVVEKLSRHPFDDYFKYVKKGEERKLKAPEKLVEALRIIIEKHMPQKSAPMGIEYIPVDNLLYLFHAVIPGPMRCVHWRRATLSMNPPVSCSGLKENIKCRRSF